MKIDFSAVLKELDGTDIIEKDKNGADAPVTIGQICVRALTIPIPTDASLTGEEVFKRLELARKIYAGGEQEIDPADAVLIRDRAAKMFGITVSGQVYEKLR